MDQIKRELFEIIKDFLDEDKREKLTQDSNLMEDLGFDSVLIMELLFTIEEKYHIEFTEYGTLLDQINRVSSFIDYAADVIGPKNHIEGRRDDES